MKKGIIVLLITVLAAGFVFAAEPTLSGSVSTEFSYDFDGNHEFGFNKEGARGNLKSEFTFRFDTISVTKGSKGENLPYAEVEAKVSLEFNEYTFTINNNEETKDNKVVKTNPVTGSSDPSAPLKLTYTAQITKANIVGEGWTIDLLKAVAGSDYAQAAIDLRKHTDKKYYALDFVYGYEMADGITVNVDKYGKVAVGLTGDKDKVNASIFAETAADLLKFDDFALQFAATFTTENKNQMFGASAKAAYEADMLSAGIATDLGYASEKFDADVAAKVKYEQEEFGASFDAYYATKAEAKKKDELVAAETNYLGAQAVADAKVVKTDVTVQAFDLLDDPDGGAKGKKTLNVIAHNNYVDGVDVKVSGLDLINDARDVSAEATITLIEDFSIGVYGKKLINKQDLGVDVEYTGIENIGIAGGAEYVIKDKELSFYGQVDYTADLFKAYARAQFAKVIDVDGAHLGLSAGIESTKLVDNATLSLTWAPLKDGETINDVLNNSYGKVIAACKITF